MTPRDVSVVGLDRLVPLADGTMRPYINLDNAASTPPFTAVLDAVGRFAGWYGNVHRGTGFKSRLSSWAFEEARETVGRFVGADPLADVVLFTRNTTESLNHLAARITLGPDPVILTTMMEHHSNDLPWRRVARVVHVRLTPQGAIDQNDLRAALEAHRGRVALLAVIGASNVTGLVNPVHTWARWAHEAGARIVVDAAQLAPHRPIDLRPHGDPEHLDFLAFSAHKMYAPFGVGVLVGPREAFEQGDPHEVGGGTVEIVSLDRVAWTVLPDREEAGTPCIIGAVALAAAIEVYRAIGWDALISQETGLAAYAIERLGQVPGLALCAAAPGVPRLGVMSFNLEGLPHGLVSAVLSHEWGIGTRSGCFCAHSYVKALLGIDDQAALALERRILSGDRTEMPGAVRVSLGLYNRRPEIDRLALALEAIADRRFDPSYRFDPTHGDYVPPGEAAQFSDYYRP